MSCHNQENLIVGEGKGGEESGVRAGTQALTLLAIPINVHVLQALAEKSRSLVELRRDTGSPPQTTMRGYLRSLDETGVVARRRRDNFPGGLDFELTGRGRDLLVVTEALRVWLAAAPEGPLRLGTSAAKSAVKALIEGWGTNMLRALAARPLSLTELDSLINNLSYPSLERRLAAMRLAGQVQKVPGRGRGTPYAVTGWLRRAVAPLAAAARWEHLHLREQAPAIAHRDVEAGFLLTAPLLRPPAGVAGSCRMAVELRNGGRSGLAGVMVSAEEGRVTQCIARLEGNADAWATGSAQAWLNAVIEGNARSLELGGDCDLAAELIAGLHGELFGARPAFRSTDSSYEMFTQ
jgi:DNA-binding HxlR family transcriptional regulator